MISPDQVSRFIASTAAWFHTWFIPNASCGSFPIPQPSHPRCVAHTGPGRGRTVDGHRVTSELEFGLGLERDWGYGALGFRFDRNHLLDPVFIARHVHPLFDDFEDIVCFSTRMCHRQQTGEGMVARLLRGPQCETSPGGGSRSVCG